MSDMSKENYYFSEDGKVMCVFTKQECLIKDTVHGSSCPSCGNNPINYQANGVKIIASNCNVPLVRRSFWCKIGIHKLKYAEKYLHTSMVKCTRKKCNAEFIEGEPGRLYRC
jgi:hypothetical protein